MENKPHRSRRLVPLFSRVKSHLEKIYPQSVTISLSQMQQSNDLKKQVHNEDHDRLITKLHKDLADREHNVIIASHTIDILTRQVETLQMSTARAEEAQRNAEADYILRHFVGYEEDTEADNSEVSIKTLQSEIARVTDAKQEALSRVNELEVEVGWVREAADAMSRELEDAKEVTQDLGHKLQESEKAKREVEHELRQLKNGMEMSSLEKTDGTTDESGGKWKSMSRSCQKVVTTLKAQVKTLTNDKQKLDQAIICCQRSADSRWRALEHDRQKIEKENNQLRAELTRLRQDLKAMGLQFRKLEEEGSAETLAVEELTHLLQTQALQKELTCRIHDVEQKVVISADTEARNKKLIAERSELLKQLEDERCYSKEVAHANLILKEATETAVKQLKEVEIELRPINSSRDLSDQQHETIAQLARLVITGLKRQLDESVDAAVASMQVYHLTSSLKAHVQHLRVLRKTYGNDSPSISSSDSEFDDTEILNPIKCEDAFVK